MSYGLVVMQSCVTENEDLRDLQDFKTARLFKTRTATPLCGTAVLNILTIVKFF